MLKGAVVVRFIEVVQKNGDPVLVHVDKVESVRRDGHKGCTVIELDSGRFVAVRTPYADVVKPLKGVQ